MKQLFAITALLLAPALPAVAQEVSAKQQAEVVNPERMAAWVGPATIDRPFSSPSGVEIRAGQDSAAITVKASRKVSEAGGWFSDLSLTASAPVSKSADASGLASLDGLSNASSLEFKYSSVKLFGRVHHAPTFEKLTAFCSTVWAAVHKPPSDTDCGADIPDNRSDLLDAYNRMFFAPGAYALLWGISGKAGYQQFKFHDGGTLAPMQQTETPWSAGGYVSIQPLSAKILFTASYQHQRAYDDADSKVVCPSGAGAPVTCVNGPIGPPVLTTKDLLSVELRQKFSPFAFAATATYDARAKVFGVDVPIYFVTDDNQGLSGGVRLGWRSDTHHFTAGVFVSKPFSLFD